MAKGLVYSVLKVAAELATARPRGKRRRDAEALRRFTEWAVFPVWLGAGFADYWWHKGTRIETTSGLEESLTHSIMMVTGGPAVLPAMFLEINAGVLAAMMAGTLAHELTVVWDLVYTGPLRKIPPGEQVTHTYLELGPMCVTAAAIVTHWEQFLALLGLGRERPRYRLRIQPWVSAQYAATIFAMLIAFGALPHADELRRCIVAKARGEEKRDTPNALRELYA